MVQTSTLRKIAFYGFFAAIGGATFIKEKIQGNFSSAEYHQKSMALLRRYKGAVEALGEPIKAGRLDLGSRYNKVDGLNARLAVPVKGPKDKGILYLDANRPSAKHSWEVKCLQLEILSQERGKPVLFYGSRPNAESSSQTETQDSGVS